MQKREQNTEGDFSRIVGFWTEERSLTVMLLLLALHLFILTPVRFRGHIFNLFSVLFLSLALLAGLLTLVRQEALRWIWVVVAGAILFKSSALVVKAPWLLVGDTLFTFFSLSALVYVIFLQVSREGPVTANRIRGAIALYLLIAMLFAFLFNLAEELVPGAFSMPRDWSRAASFTASVIIINTLSILIGKMTTRTLAVRLACPESQDTRS